LQGKSLNFMQKLIRITTVPLSLEKLLEGQLTFMNKHYEVIAISADKERLERFGRDNGVRTFWVEMTRAITPVKDLKAVWKLYRYFKKEKPLIVHTHTPKAGIVGMLSAKLAGVPYRLHTVAGLPLLEATGTKRKILDLVEKLTYSLATKIYPNSKGLEEIILKEKFTAENKLKIIGKGSSNGIDTKYFDPDKFTIEDKREIKIQIGIPLEDFVFLFIGRLVSDKGINELVAAFDALYNKKPEISLLLIGPLEEDLDPLKPETLELIEDHPKIYTTGYVTDVRPFLAVGEVLTFPSYREGFPNVVMQAGAMNLPALVTNINGCNEIIEDGKNGIIVPVKDMNSLYQAMRSMLTESVFRDELSRRARSEICKHYEREEFWELLLREYSQIQNK